MKKVKFVKDGKLVNSFTGQEVDFLNENDNNRYFVGVIKGGHCGRGYYIPFLKSVGAKSPSLAMEFLMNSGRLKYRDKHCIIDFCEVSLPEVILIKIINKYDLYVGDISQSDEREAEIERRKIRLEMDYNYNNAWDNKRFIENELELVRDADSFDEDCVVERYCAPKIVNGKIIYPTKLNMRKLLDEFFEINVRKLAIEKGEGGILSVYYTIYGENNPFGISYSGGIIKYKDVNGNDAFVKATEKERQFLDKFEQERIAKKQEEQMLEEIAISNRPSKVDKFKRRLELTRGLKSKNEKQKSN